MKRTFQGVILATSLLTGGLSFAQDNTQGKASAQKGMVEYRGFMAPTDERALLERLHYTNQQEIMLGKLAQQNAQSPEVKSFADMMVKDHTAMDQKLMTYAQSKGMKLSDKPRPMNDMEKKAMAQDQATMEELKTLKGLPFDSCYMAGQVGDHDAALGKVLAARQGMPNAPAEVSAMLQEASQKMPAHREQAWTILGKLGSSMGVGGSGTPGDTMDHGDMDHGTSGTPTK
ncbi:DUF4142 domain-containing protein [Myxococcus sp. Y35]|uniref:DUF4142 domain-containing protein n=1 Tax=Pseudomyxococcus flavus TaxID=3115648 RepID=UPI003CE697DA